MEPGGHQMEPVRLVSQTASEPLEQVHQMVPVAVQARQKVAAPALAEKMLVLAAPALQAQKVED